MKLLLFILSLHVFSHYTYAQLVHLKTEHYPPYTFKVDSNDQSQFISGACTDIVLEIMNRTNYQYTLELIPWKRAYEAAKNNSHTGVFCTTRTAKREKLFKWVGPIADNDYVLLSHSEKEININSIDEIKNYRVGAYLGSAGESFMKNAGAQVESVRSDKLNVLKLQRNRIDLWIAGHLYGLYLAKQNNVTGLKAVFTVQEAQMFLAFNTNTPNTIIEKMNLALQEMRQEGFIEQVYSKYR